MFLKLEFWQKLTNSFSIQGKEDEAIHYDDKAVEDLLDRSKMGIEQKENWSNEYLSSFKVASYVTKEEEEEVRLYAFFE